MDFLLNSNFMPHGYCLRWEPALLVTFVIGNILIFLSYFSIPGALALFVKKRKDLAFPWMFSLFAVFIFMCGITHLIKVWTIWHAHYWLEASLDLATGIVSLITSVLLWKMLPKAIKIPSPSQYREANEKLRKLAAIVECSEDGIVGVDNNGVITSWNRGASKLYGYSSQEAIGKNFEFLISDGHVDEYKSTLESTTKNQSENTYEAQHRHKNGQHVYVSVSVSPVSNSDEEEGEQLGFSIISRDITRKMEAEEKLKYAKDQAVLASKFKSEFLANMSHEIRTPLNAVIGLSDLLGRSNLSREQKDLTDTIVASGNVLLDLINNILDYSKLEANKLELELVEFRPLNIIEESAEILAGEARSKELSLMTYVDPNLPEAVFGDPGRVRQILINLIGNAIKFTEEGEIVVKAELEAIEQNRVTIKIRVIDTGIGISDDAADKIFAPFKQASPQVSRKYGGTGLGLSISRQLVNLMNGRIGIERERTSGTEVWLEIPFEIGDTKPYSTESISLGTFKILLVDGPAGSSSIIKNYADSWGMSCNSVEDWQSGKLLLENEHFDLIFIDHSQDPLLDTTNISLLKDRYTTKVLITSSNDADTGSRAKEVGYDAILIRPIKQSQLFDCIANLMERTEHLNGEGKDVTESIESVVEIKDTRLILVVEDNPVNQKVALLQLRDLGLAAHAVGNGIEALAATETAKYSLILMDCQMPEMDGYETTRHLRKREARNGTRTPIIAMTAHAMKGDREQCLAAGMDDYISKPVNQDKLKSLLDRWMEMPSNLGIENTKQQTRSGGKTGSGIELTLLEKTYGKEATEEILETFLEQTRLRLRKLKKSIENRDAIASHKLLHDLKGMSSSVFASELTRLSYLTENLVQNKPVDWGLVSANIETLEQDFLNVVAEIDRQKHSH